VKSVLVTGAAGFIGSHLCEYYLRHGYQVVGLDNYLTGSLDNIEYLQQHYKSDFFFIELDVSKPWPYIENFHIQNLKYVFHFASAASVKNYQKYALETMWVNSTGLSNAIRFADDHKARLIFASTSEVYGTPLSSPQKESDWGNVNSFGARSCYDESKRFGEALIYTSNKAHDTSHGVLRIFNTYGPRMNPDDDRVVNSFISLAKATQDLVVYGNGKQTRSFCFIDDLINGISLYANSELNQPVNLGNDSEISILELAELVIKMTESHSKIVFKPLPKDDPPQRRPDLSIARTLLGYAPSVSLSDGLKKFIGTK
jgi:nucleoside-diphosphate-sugar epimerase